VVRAARARVRRVTVHDALTTTRCSPSRARGARAGREARRRRAPKRFRTARRPWPAVDDVLVAAPATRARTGSSCSSPPQGARPCGGRAEPRPAPAPIGLGARDTLPP
jgi:hypothetical protein